MIANLPQREEYLRKKRKIKRIKYGIAAFLFVLIVGLASYISHRPEIRISKVKLTGGVLVTETDIESSSLTFMKGSHFLLFPKNNSFWYPKQKLEKYLSEAFRRIDTIDIKRDNFKTLSITITERKPVAIWCDSLPGQAKTVISTTTNSVVENVVISEQCYFMDQNSTIFSEAPYFSGDAYFKYYGQVGSTTPETDLSVNPIGKYYIASTTMFGEITGFIEATRKMSLRPAYLVAEANEEFSLIVYGGGRIYFDTKTALTRVAQNLESLLSSKELSTNVARMSIQYIDLRYGNKLFYKLK